MRALICCLVCFSLLMAAPFCEARKAKPVHNTPRKAEVAAPVTEPAVPVAVQQITQIRWLMQKNTEVKDTFLRLVLDVTGPVEADAVIVNTPAPFLAVQIKGAVPGGGDSSLQLDGQIAGAAHLTGDGNNSRLMIALETGTVLSDCRIFTLPPDSAAHKPFRLIVDISTPAPDPGFRFTPGLKDKIIVLDPGHGGSDAGAVGPGGTREKTVTLAVAGDVKALLEKAGAKVYLTRTGDDDVFGPLAAAREELQARVDVAQRYNADLFISIHANAAANPLARGTATYYYKKTAYDALLAYEIQKGMVRAGALKDKSFFPANFYVVKYTSMPAVLVELAFISNAGEERLLGDVKFQETMARGIVEGVDRFFMQTSAQED